MIDIDELIAEGYKWLSDFGGGYQDYPGGPMRKYDGVDLIRNLTEGLVAVRAERDAALDAIGRVAEEIEAVAGGITSSSEAAGYRNGLLRAAQIVRAALDGAPEPEWEWEYCYRSKQTGNRWGSGSLMDAQLGAKALDSVIERRVKAGPWEPVEGEKP